MKIIADLHIHSRYSRAVSPKMDLFEIERWAVKKGITLVAAGDWTHPIWFRELGNELEEQESGIYKLKNNKGSKIKFLLSTEISNIYSQGGKLRRIHSVIFAPNLAAVEKLNKELTKKGAKLMSDGRPIIGMSCRELLEIALSIDKNFLFIPAHAWTPWYGIYGSMSGFDSLSECFGDMTQYIHAIETGLSSDPLMNWQIEELDNRSILSFSDAHSGPKLGREATVFIPRTNSQYVIRNPQFSYSDIIDAIKQNPEGKLKIGYTIEFFPEEGKYHWSGHRDCGIRYSPAQIKEKGTICPVCRRTLTEGVENRVIDLSEKSRSMEDAISKQNSYGTTFVSDKLKKRVPYISLIPLMEIFLELNNSSPTKALAGYENAVSLISTEFDILMNVPYDTLSTHNPRLSQAVKIIRERNAYVDPGFDGIFGKVKIFKDEKTTESAQETTQQTLF